MLGNRTGVQRVLPRAGSLKGRKLANFTGQFHFISFNFVQFHSFSSGAGRPEATRRGMGSSRAEFLPSCRFTFYGGEQPRFSNFDILLSATAKGSYFILLKGILFG